jgi:hypothetical protein
MVQISKQKTENELKENPYNDLFKAIEKIKLKHYGSAINFIERYINTKHKYQKQKLKT